MNKQKQGLKIIERDDYDDNNCYEDEKWDDERYNEEGGDLAWGQVKSKKWEVGGLLWGGNCGK